MIKLPSFRQIWDVRLVFARVYRNLRGHKPVFARPELYAQRAEICYSCPKCVNPGTRHAQCLVCSCLISLKISLTSERCPDHPQRW